MNWMEQIVNIKGGAEFVITVATGTITVLVKKMINCFKKQMNSNNKKANQTTYNITINNNYWLGKDDKFPANNK